MDLTFSNVQAHINTVYVLITKESKKNKGQPAGTVWNNEEERVGLQEPNLRLKVSNISSFYGFNFLLQCRHLFSNYFAFFSYHFQGEMIFVQESGMMLFLGSPSVLNLEDLTRFPSISLIYYSIIIILID